MSYHTDDNITLFLPDNQADVHGVFQELWYKIPSGSLASLRADSRFPNNPDVVNILQNFDAPFNFHTNYGQRLTAYLQVNFISYGTKSGGSFHPYVNLQGISGSQIIMIMIMMMIKNHTGQIELQVKRKHVPTGVDWPRGFWKYSLRLHLRNHYIKQPFRPALVHRTLPI